jgi:hypothetical protein
MPPITDPATLAAIKQQQLNPQVQPMPFPGAKPMMKVQSPADQQLMAQRALAIQQARGKLPGEVSKSGTDSEIAKLTLRKMRLEQGLDPDTGKPAATGITAGVVGDAAIADLSEGDKNIVKGIVQGRIPVSSLALARNPALYKLTQRAFALEPGTDLTTFARRQAAFQKFMSNPNSPMVRVNQALQHLDRFAANAKNLENFHSGLTDPLNVGNYVRAGTLAANKDPRYEAFATDRDALATELAAAFQGSGNSALADRNEWQKRLSAANSPEGFDAVIKEAVGLLGGRVEASNAQFKQSVGANADFYDLMSPAARKVYDKYKDPASAEAGGDTQLSTTVKTVPIPKGYQDDHMEFLHKHPPGTLTVGDYIQMRKGLDQKYADQIGAGHPEIPQDQAESFVKEYNAGKNPGKVPGMQMPLTEMEHLHAAAASHPIGVGVATAANAAGMGIPEALLDQETRDKFHMAENEHQPAAFLGETIGSIGGMKGLEKVGFEGLKAVGNDKLKKLGIDILNPTARAKLLGDVAVNTGYGAARGFGGADEGQGGTGAIEGALGGAAGALVGNAVTKGATPLVSARVSQALSKLNGVKTTTLQRLGLGGAEETLSGIPGAHGTRAASLSSFNRDNSNRALSYMTSPLLRSVEKTLPKSVANGTEANAAVHDALSKAYNIIRPQIGGTVDPTFTSGIRALTLSGTSTPAKKVMFREIQGAIKAFTDKAGNYNGQTYKDASEKLRNLIEDFSNQAENGTIGARDMARLAEQTRKQMQTIIQRQTPEVGQALKQVERGWAHKMRIEDASNRALQNNETGYSPGQYLMSLKKLDISGGKSAYARGKAFDQQYGEAAGKVMGLGPAKKVSLKEMGYTAGGLTAAGLASPTLAGTIAGVGGALYVPGLKQGTKALLTGTRPKAIDNQYIRRGLSNYVRHKTTGN